jgi:hypothetical protein
MELLFITENQHCLRKLVVADYFWKGSNGAASARRAGFRAKRAAIIASELLHDPRIQTAIQERLTDHLRRLEVDAEMVISGIVKTIQKAQAGGSGAWQSATILRGLRIAGTLPGTVQGQAQIMAQLEAGRRRAAGLPNDEEEEPEEQPAPESDEQKPN